MRKGLAQQTILWFIHACTLINTANSSQSLLSWSRYYVTCTQTKAIKLNSTAVKLALFSRVYWAAYGIDRIAMISLCIYKLNCEKLIKQALYKLTKSLSLTSSHLVAVTHHFSSPDKIHCIQGSSCTLTEILRIDVAVRDTHLAPWIEHKAQEMKKWRINFKWLQ